MSKYSKIILDVMFVIDNTISMLAEDYDGENTRLEGVKTDCSYIIDELAGQERLLLHFIMIRKY